MARAETGGVSKWTLGELKVGPPQSSVPVCAPLQSYILGLLTALGGQLLVEFWELRLHRNADGAPQKMGPPRHGTPLLQEWKGNEETAWKDNGSLQGEGNVGSFECRGHLEPLSLTCAHSAGHV